MHCNAAKSHFSTTFEMATGNGRGNLKPFNSLMWVLFILAFNN